MQQRCQRILRQQEWQHSWNRFTELPLCQRKAGNFLRDNCKGFMPCAFSWVFLLSTPFLHRMFMKCLGKKQWQMDEYNGYCWGNSSRRKQLDAGAWACAELHYRDRLPSWHSPTLYLFESLLCHQVSQAMHALNIYVIKLVLENRLVLSDVWWRYPFWMFRG